MKLQAFTEDNVLVTADQAAVHHQKGDVYFDPKTDKRVQLHVCRDMRNHFEFMRNQEQQA